MTSVSGSPSASWASRQLERGRGSPAESRHPRSESCQHPSIAVGTATKVGRWQPSQRPRARRKIENRTAASGSVNPDDNGTRSGIARRDNPFGVFHACTHVDDPTKVQDKPAAAARLDALHAGAD